MDGMLQLRGRLRTRESVQAYLDHIGSEPIRVPERHVIDLREPQTVLRDRVSRAEGEARTVISLPD